MLAPSRQLLEAARCEGRAVAALNFYNAETLRAHIEAANGCAASVILQTTESTIRYLGLKMVVALRRRRDRPAEDLGAGRRGGARRLGRQARALFGAAVEGAAG